MALFDCSTVTVAKGPRLLKMLNAVDDCVFHLLENLNELFFYHSIPSLITHTHTQTFNGLFSRTTWVGRYQKDKPFWILLKQRWGGSGISRTICKSFAPRSRQTTTPARHHSIFFTGRMPFLPIRTFHVCYA